MPIIFIKSELIIAFFRENYEEDKVSMKAYGSAIASKRFNGFIAQDVKKVAEEVNFEFSGIDAPKNERDFFGLRYAEFVVPLVKAVQEQQELIEKLQEENGLIYQELSKLKNIIQEAMREERFAAADLK